MRWICDSCLFPLLKPFPSLFFLSFFLSLMAQVPSWKQQKPEQRGTHHSLPTSFPPSPPPALFDCPWPWPQAKVTFLRLRHCSHSVCSLAFTWQCLGRIFPKWYMRAPCKWWQNFQLRKPCLVQLSQTPVVWVSGSSPYFTVINCAARNIFAPTGIYFFIFTS